MGMAEFHMLCCIKTEFKLFWARDTQLESPRNLFSNVSLVNLFQSTAMDELDASIQLQHSTAQAHSKI